jgi:hypothetical protein
LMQVRRNDHAIRLGLERGASAAAGLAMGVHRYNC